MAKKVQVSLKEVVFVGPFDKNQNVKLRLGNPPANPRMAFKLKTTRPRRITMMPVFGYIAPGTYATIRLWCASFRTRRPLSVRDRVTVLLAPCTEKAPLHPSQLWQHGPKEPKDPRRVVLPVKYEQFGKPAPAQKEPEKKAAPEQSTSSKAPAAATQEETKKMAPVAQPDPEPEGPAEEEAEENEEDWKSTEQEAEEEGEESDEPEDEEAEEGSDYDTED